MNRELAITLGIDRPFDQELLDALDNADLAHLARYHIKTKAEVVEVLQAQNLHHTMNGPTYRLHVIPMQIIAKKLGL